ncbi:NAD-dependent epimerase/dehydratase family protein [Actinomadura sp. LD22]|uniref:NAD-dependent epimerase/dehydratase family protein n=1 Tax=Actinomadura physcomitrii TaxID=2650748 RepID=A0A6I4MBE5_9ACTN|nr:SDR family oxidoreductase [Actinomadura physcomitrii]MWA01554.1 NAD-dependent epimerase/dehydratase family protein [Actinomadura physcomitrii]
MHVFVTGGSGLTGPAVVAELLAAGHTVTGLARSDAAAARLESLGAVPHRGSLDDLDSLRSGAEAADGVVHMAFGGDFADPDDMMRRDRTAIETLGRSGAPLVITSGTLVMPAGRESTEQDEPDVSGIAAFRLPGERACLGFADRGVRASVVRLAPTVHGPGDYGFMGMLVDTARKTGVSAYVGDGANRWPAVHRLDAAVLFRLALEKAPAGSVLHGAAENVPFKSIAEAIGRGLGLPAVSLPPDEAAAHFPSPFMATVYGIDAPVSSARTQELLGWAPVHPTLLDDLEHGDYLTGPAS